MILMILARRIVHFWAIVALTCTLPWVFLAGLWGRPFIPNVDDSANDLFAAANFPDTATARKTLGQATLQANDISIQAELSAVSTDQLSLALQPAAPLRFADVLVYWIVEAPDLNGEEILVLGDAILLGQLSGTSRRQFPLPASVQEQLQAEPGYLLFYSQGQQQAIAVAPLPKTLIPKN